MSTTRLYIKKDDVPAGEDQISFNLFLNTTTADGKPTKAPYFAAADGSGIRGFLAPGKGGEGYSGAVDLVIPGNKDEGVAPVQFGTLFLKEGPNGKFFSGYTSELVKVGTTKGKDGKEYPVAKFVGPLERDEEGNVKNAVSVTANLHGPDADKVLGVLPVIKRPAKGHAA